ncbi:MAG TPA: DUF1800 domain-containing protein [Bryobacteraceae bacterium]|nr:DUF1800 domain-containing protein [Bryobacteraceae bacterium]
MSRRFILTWVGVPLSLIVATLANSDGRFDKKLPADQQVLHVLNRLTFGPRPGDIADVRRIGVEKWIDLQLHPDRIPENPALEARLKPLETLRMEPEQILKDYPLVPAGLAFKPVLLPELLTQDQVRRVTNGTAEERIGVLNSLDAAKRKQVLAVVPPPALASTPEIQKEAEAARQAQAEERSKEMRRLMPPLNDLLNPDQMNTAMRGNTEQLRALFDYLDPEKRKQVAGVLPPQSLAEFPELRRQGMRVRQPQQVLTEDLKQGKVYRALYSNRQLEEVLVDFWFNHFNVQEGKMNVRPFVASYERDAIRPHVFGHFKDLLLATAQHPAMLYYLDNYESISPGAFDIGPFAGPAQAMAQQLSRQARGLNENYGREVMELHTLGVDGGYTQQDVIAVARCFTGWTIRQPNTKPEFVFAGFMHDSTEKTVLGHKIAAGRGIEDGMQVIDILAHHPSTARFISKELAQRFVADDPPKSLVDRMAQTFTKTDGDLRAVLQTMFSSPEFLSEGAWQAKVKSPLEWVVSAVRALDADATDTFVLGQRISDLGELLYGKVEPSGYPNTGEAWLNTASLLGRMNFANSLASGQIPGVKLDAARIDGKNAAEVAHELLSRDATPQTLEALDKGLQGKDSTGRFVAGLVLSSPDFQRR